MEIRNVVRNVVFDVVNGEPTYLILKTKKGYWQNPQGGIDQGESEIEALIRETDEETQSNIQRIFEYTRTFTEYPTERKGKEIYTKLYAFASMVNSSKPIILSKEDGHVAYKWIKENEVKNYLNEYPEQILVFKEVLSKLKKEKQKTHVFNHYL